ncbi:MAG: flavoprotein [Phycisphaerae bacterium]
MPHRNDQTPLAGDPADAQTLPLVGKEVIVAVCGGIAAYKVCEVVSKLVQAGAGVTVAMTHAAQQFVTPLTFETLSGRRVHVGLHQVVDAGDTQHIGLTERADVMLVAPATTNVIARVAQGICDDLVSTMICAAACPVVFAPSMNSRMWDHPIAQENYAKLASLGYTFIGPEEGWLACRNVGAGRLTDPADIVAELTRMLTLPGEMPPLVGEVVLEDVE